MEPRTGAPRKDETGKVGPPENNFGDETGDDGFWLSWFPLFGRCVEGKWPYFWGVSVYSPFEVLGKAKKMVEEGRTSLWFILRFILFLRG